MPHLTDDEKETSMDPPTDTYFDDAEADDDDDDDDDESMAEVVADAEAADVDDSEEVEAVEEDDDNAEEEDEPMAEAAVVVEDADDNDDDDEEQDEDDAAAAVVSQEDAEAVEVESEAVIEAAPVVAVPAAAVVSSSSTVKAKTPKKKKKKSTAGSGKKSSSKSATSASTSKSTSKKKKKKKPSGTSNSNNTSTSKNSSGNTKQGGNSSNSTSIVKAEAQWTRIPPARLDAATQARQLLMQTAPTLPLVSSDIHVRSFGRLSMESSYSDRSKFSKANALYPVGYSCDRYEFSPVHGRILKMRCTILDGRKIVEKQVKLGMANPRTDLPDGPVFRIMWGQGIDEDVDQSAYPYDPYTMSAPLSAGVEVDAVATPSHAKKIPSAKGGAVGPRVGMRVKAMFENNETFPGTIVRVIKPDNKAEVSSSTGKKKKRKKTMIEILYDDGSTELNAFPCPDIVLMSPEAEPEVDSNGHVEYDELKGLPVHTVIGLSPIEAWGKVLSKLGLTDEFMASSAMHAMSASRQMGFQEAKGKIESKYQRKPTTATSNSIATTTATPSSINSNIPPKRNESENGGVGHDAAKAATVSSNGVASVAAAEADVESKATAEREEEEPTTVKSESEMDVDDTTVVDAGNESSSFESNVADLRKELAAVKTEGRAAAAKLAEKRINALGMYLSNPFPDTDASIPQQSSWLALAVRKEKTKMGSTGNKKKIVTATDLLERNDTFFNSEIELLIEGLPGSEYCSPYIFQSMRSGGAATSNRTWVHEAQVRSEKEREKRAQAHKHQKDKQSEFQERESKRKQLDDLRDERKRQKDEEEDDKKKARIEERMSRLDVQVDERLFKEACFQREKAIVALAKTFIREYARRRKAAELVSGQSVADAKRRLKPSREALLPLPNLSRVYDEDVLRVWDFMSSFGSFFEKKGYVEAIPSMNALQSAIDCLRGKKDVMPKENAIQSLTGLAVALCKPLAASQTRLLFASLVALYPVLQKDFGAAFFNEINEVNPGDKEKEKEKKEDSIITSAIEDLILPVDSMTWQEIARVEFLADALGELGFPRQDAAHLLRGYRSAGHPNSKESRRIRRVEDYSIALLRQALSDGTQISKERSPTVVRIEAPTIPSCFPSDWIFYLHNVRSMKPSSIKFMIKNVEKSLELLKASDEPDAGLVSTLSGCLDKLGTFEGAQSKSSAETVAFKEVKQQIIKILDGRSRQEPNRAILAKSGEGTGVAKGSIKPGKVTSSRRQQMGLLGTLSLSKQELKKLVHAREEYMEEALKLKEDMIRQKRKENKEDGEDDDDDDDDDEDDENDDDSHGPSAKSNGETAIATPAEVAAAVVASEDNETPGAIVEANSSPDKDKSDVKEAEQKDAESKVQEDSPGETDEVSKEMEGLAAMDVDSEPSVTTAQEAKGGRSPAGNEAECSESGAKPVEVDPSLPAKIGKPTEFDEFCEDIPSAPEMIRRCLAVLRSLSLSGPSEPFSFPVDPQSNPGYYDMVLRPMCLWKAGKDLQSAGNRLSVADDTNLLDLEAEVDEVVLQFGRNIRLISQNCLAYTNAGPMVVSAGSELLRIFERLLLDWVLAPTASLTPLNELDDDRCVEHHSSDESSTVLLCDGCEGNFNISRLDPPLLKVPQGDWFCPRCVSGRWWGHLDPRLGKNVQRNFSKSDTPTAGEQSFLKGRIKQCSFLYPEGSDPKPSLVYEVKMADGTVETWTVEKVDESLKALGEPEPPVRCLWALSESQGYGCEIPDKSLLRELVPVPLNPNISDAAAQAATSSSVFRDTIDASGTLMLTNPEDMKASEWLRLLLLLVMKCSSSDVMQNVASQVESEAAETMAKHLESLGKVKGIADVFEAVYDKDDEEEKEVPKEKPTDVPKVDIEDEDHVMVAEVEEEEEDAFMEEAKEDATTDEKTTGMEESVPPKAANGQATTAAKEIESSATAKEIEPNAVEVINGTGGGPSAPGNEGTQEAKEIVVVDPVKERRSRALALKSKRQRAREDSISAFTMKSQLRPAVASFGEDAVSFVIDTTLASKLPGLSFSSTRCRRTVCDFCGLTDEALGTPLVRVPDEDEWNEIIPHASNSRRAQLIADMQGVGIENDADGDEEMDLAKESAKPSKMVSLSIRIGGELVSVKEKPEVFDRTNDGGMLEFCPRNSEGYQNELSFRSEHGLPFVTGSLTAHECCAMSVHKARKVHVVQRFKERQLELADMNAGMSCGRTLAIGNDAIGRFYWKFHKEPDSLFVFVPAVVDGVKGEWHRFSDSESIASVLISLGKDDVVRDLNRAFPKAATMCREGTWSNAIWKRHFPNALVAREGDADMSDQESTSGSNKGETATEKDEEDEDEPFDVNEKVLVETKSGKLLWNAKVIDASRSRDDGPVTEYKVRYEGWSSRFDEWVDKDRLVEPSENNLQVQEEMLEEAAAQRDGLPPALIKMAANSFLRAPDRARGNVYLPDFASVASASASESTADKAFAIMKAAILLIEAALPLGAVDATSKGVWRPDVAMQWRLMVEGAAGPTNLLRCVILLEDAITEEWYKQDVSHTRACLPDRWLALSEGSVASLSMRVVLLDRGILFGSVDRERFVEQTEKKRKR